MQWLLLILSLMTHSVGKSTVTKVLSDIGVIVIDADKLGHQSYEYGSTCFDELVRHFGSEIMLVPEEGNPTINRKALGSIVFNDKSQLQALQGIVWPEIRRRAQLLLDEYRQRGDVPVVLLEAAVSVCLFVRIDHK